MQYGKAYPYLKALLDASIEAAPDWAKAPGKFVASLSEQLKTQAREQNKQLENEIRALSEDDLREIIKEAGCKQQEHIELIAAKVKLIPEILQVLDYRFDKLDDKLEQIESLILQAKPAIKFPLPPSLYNQTPPESCFVGRKDMLARLTQWYENPNVRIGALIGWGGVGKSSLVRKWYDSLQDYGIEPDGIFWWGFYRNAYLEQFLNALLGFVSAGQIDADSIKSTWAKLDKIKQYVHQGAYLIILDGLEQMQSPESGDQFGRMIHREFTELVHYLAEEHHAGGLCLITTRFELRGLDPWLRHGYQKEPLINLSPEDAISMLKERAIKATDDHQLTDVVNRYKGHALSLTSVAGFLKRYYDSDITKAPDIEFVLGDKERFKDVNKLLRKYTEKMSEAERVFLNIFSLFRHEITQDDFAGVFRKRIEGTKFNDALVKMSDLDFKDLLNGLLDWRLISLDKTANTYTAHPLVKSYFESQFDATIKKLCHKRIYHYFGEKAPHRPETLDQMQPLFEQVHHGCAAGLYQEVGANIYRDKIHRGDEFFVTRKLGAWEIELSLVRTFFPKGDLSKLPLVSSKSDQAFLLNEAGIALLCTGRPEEAGEPLTASIRLYIEGNQIAFASRSYQNLADLQFRSGELASGMESAQQALEMGEKGELDGNVIFSKAYLAWILFLSGETQKAEMNFRQADQLEKEISGYRLYSIWGSFHTDFLISMERIDEAYELTIRSLAICKRNNWLADVSRCHRCLGTIESQRNDLQGAQSHLHEALKIAREVGVPFLEIEGLIELGRLNLVKKAYKDAIRYGQDVLTICRRTGFRFYEPDAEIVLSEAHLGLEDTDKAKNSANSAYDKARSMKYRWAEGDAAHLLARIYLAEQDPKNARHWLEKAIACRSQILDPELEDSQSLSALV